MSTLTTTSNQDPFPTIDCDWLDWSLTLADPTVRVEVRDQILARAHQHATNPDTRRAWFTLAGRLLGRLVDTVNPWEPWHELALDGPAALAAYTWEQRFADLDWLTPDTPTLDLLPHPQDPATVELLTRVFARHDIDRDGWLTDADCPWPAVEDTIRVILALRRCHDLAADTTNLLYHAADAALDDA